MADLRICLDARTVHSHFPGVGRYTLNLAVAMAAQLSAPDSLTLLRDATQLERWAGTSVAGVRTRDVTVSPFALRQQWIVPRLVRQLGANLYHSPYYLMPLRPRVPSVLTVHDVIPLRYPALFPPVHRLIYGASIRLAARAARVVIAVSRTTARDLEDCLRLPPKRIVVIPEAADPSFQPQPQAAVAALRRRLGLPECHALYVGSNKPHKNLVRLVDAWARLRPSPLPLVIAGAWDARFPEARQRVATLGLSDTVRFLGPVGDADLPALYSSAELFVFPSRHEGFGLPVIEAMASGIPVACADAAGLPEVTGDAAVLFDPNDAAAIADAIASLHGDAARRADLAARGRHRAAQFSWAESARATLAAYRTALALT